MGSFSGKKLLLLGFVVVLLVIIPLTVYLVQQQQKIKAGAQAASTLSFINPASNAATAAINAPTDTPSFEVWVDPQGVNQISFVKLSISYDATKVKVNSFTPDANNFPTVLQNPNFGNGKATVTLSVGSSADKIITTKKRVATITFGLASTATAGNTQVAFDPDPATQILSLATSDQFNENVLAGAPPGTITIAQAAVGAAPSPSPSQSPAASPNAQTPVCTALNLDKGPNGTAPYTINFTAVGSEPGGKIVKVTFNWGDGPTQDVTDTIAGGGIGTTSINTQLVHIYNNPGNYTATATLTDNNGTVSAIGPCTKAIVITAASTSGGGGGGTSGGASGGNGTTQTATVTSPTPTPTPTIAPNGGVTTKGGLPASGPGDKIISFGTLGIISTVIGALLLFGL